MRQAPWNKSYINLTPDPFEEIWGIMFFLKWNLVKIIRHATLINEQIITMSDRHLDIYKYEIKESLEIEIESEMK